MIERPILFSGPMVRAILEGRKTQTRRVVKPVPRWGNWPHRVGDEYLCSMAGDSRRCPYGKPGDRLWVRESFYVTSVHSRDYGAGFMADHPTGSLAEGDGGYNFRSFSEDLDQAGEQWNWAQKHCGTDRWIPSIHMPRWASRITLEITDVRVERLQEISEEDALTEGIEAFDFPVPSDPPGQVQRMFGTSAYFPQTETTATSAFRRLWDQINGKTHPWASNPFVWVISFRRLEAGA